MLSDVELGRNDLQLFVYLIGKTVILILLVMNSKRLSHIQCQFSPHRLFTVYIIKPK